jgi:hypothetical protein
MLAGLAAFQMRDEGRPFRRQIVVVKQVRLRSEEWI